MLLSQYYLPLLKEKPSEAQIISHMLMLKSGMIRQSASGLYNWLPLGLQVLQNIQKILRFNMNKAGFIETLTPCVQDSELWKKSGRFNAYGQELLKFHDRHDHELVFAPTSEEAIVDMVKGSIHSYKDLPKVLYQIQWKFRDEIRPRFGVMRGREFLMKDAYSFDIDKENAMKTYERVLVTYMHTFRDLGLNVIPIVADSGEIGGDLSHEFYVIAKTGEELVYYDQKFDLLGESLFNNIGQLKKLYAATVSTHSTKDCPIPQEELLIGRGIEVGHIFNFGDKYSSTMNLMVNNDSGKLVPVQMGSYGIGVGRVVAAIIEDSHDEKGIIWPMNVAPFKVSILNLNVKDEGSVILSQKMYNHLTTQAIDVLYDDTRERAGVKFATHDLIGSPWQVIISPTKAPQNMVELKHRASGVVEDVSVDFALNKIENSLDVK